MPARASAESRGDHKVGFAVVCILSSLDEPNICLDKTEEAGVFFSFDRSGMQVENDVRLEVSGVYYPIFLDAPACRFNVT